MNHHSCAPLQVAAELRDFQIKFEEGRKQKRERQEERKQERERQSRAHKQTKPTHRSQLRFKPLLKLPESTMESKQAKVAEELIFYKESNQKLEREQRRVPFKVDVLPMQSAQAFSAVTVRDRTIQRDNLPMTALEDVGVNCGGGGDDGTAPAIEQLHEADVQQGSSSSDPSQVDIVCMRSVRPPLDRSKHAIKPESKQDTAQESVQDSLQTQTKQPMQGAELVSIDTLAGAVCLICFYYWKQ